MQSPSHATRACLPASEKCTAGRRAMVRGRTVHNLQLTMQVQQGLLAASHQEIQVCAGFPAAAHLILGFTALFESLQLIGPHAVLPCGVCRAQASVRRADSQSGACSRRRQPADQHPRHHAQAVQSDLLRRNGAPFSARSKPVGTLSQSHAQERGSVTLVWHSTCAIKPVGLSHSTDD